MKPERAIVVGAGVICDHWIPPLQAEGITVAALVDIRPDAAQRQIEKHALVGTKTSADLDQTLRDTPADFLVDLTPPEVHHDVTIKALRAGLHVIGEKPMAATMDHARDMVRMSDETGKLYMVSQSRRWYPTTDAIAKTVAAGRLGALTALNCDYFMGVHCEGFRNDMASPLLLDMAIHHFDLARMFARRDAVSVYADEFNPRESWYAGNAAANCLFEMDGGLRFAYRASWCAEGCQTGWNGDWRVIGDKGTLLYTGDQDVRGEIVAGDEGFHRPMAPLNVAPSDVAHPAMRGALREMLRFLRTGQRPQTECHDNIKSLAMVLAAIESATERRRVNIN